MARLGAAPDTRLLGLDKVADAVGAFELGALAKIRERADFAFVADYAFLGTDTDLQMRAVANRNVAEPGRALDQDARANAALAEYLHVGADNTVAADFHFRPYISGGGIDQGYPGLHQSAVDLFTNLTFHLGQLLARVYPGKLGRPFRNPCVNRMAAAPGDRDYIGKIILMLIVIGLKLGQGRPQKRRTGEIDTGVDLVDRALAGRGVARLDDRGDVARIVTNHAAVGSGVGEFHTDKR
jgi:hypothetical protein